MRTPDDLTQRIYNKSDTDLRKKLEDCTKWVWDETGYGDKPSDEALAEARSNLSGTDLPELSNPWIGNVRRQFIEVSFAWLRDRYRNEALCDFMQKVESLGNVIHDQQ